MDGHRIKAKGAVLAILLALAACGVAKKWTHPSADAAQYAADRDWCEAEADMAVGYLPDQHYFMAPAVAMQTFNECMTKRGWRLERVG